MDLDNEKILEFLADLKEQLGAAGTEAFRVVADRVVAEAIIWTGVGIGLLILGFVVGVAFLVWGLKNKDDTDSELSIAVGLVIWTLASVAAAIAIVPSAVNLLSPEYATIERILRLVGS